MDDDALRRELDEHLTTVLAVAERPAAELGAPVPGCPGWTVAGLLGHLGSVHRWVLGALDGAGPAPAPDAPGDAAGAVAWFREGAPELRARLAAVDPDTPCWGFGPRPRTARFWVRRMAHEHAVHHWDAAHALGEATDGLLGTALALDGLAELAEVFVPLQARTGRFTLPAPVALAPTDGDGRVVLGEGDPRAELVGPAHELLLVAWRRLPLDATTTTLSGDRGVVEETLAGALTP